MTKKDHSALDIVLAGEAGIFCGQIHKKIQSNKGLSAQFNTYATQPQKDQVTALQAQVKKPCAPQYLELAEIFTNIATKFMTRDELRSCLSRTAEYVDLSNAYTARKAPNFGQLWSI